MGIHRRILHPAFSAALLALAMSGCGKDQATNIDNSTGTDENALRTMMTDQAAFFDGGQDISDGQVGVTGATPRTGPSGAPIESFYFVREITSREVRRNVEVDTSGDRPVAHVTVNAALHGIFHLYFRDPEHIYLPGVIDKRLNAVADRQATFVRVARADGDRYRGWRLREISGTEVLSNPTTKDIVSLEIVSNSVNRTITDPLELVPLRELPVFQPGERVTLRVKTTDDTDFVFLHSGRFKDEFHPVGDGVFEGTWSVGERLGPRWVAIDVIDKETLFDDEAPYDSAAWVLPYRVAGEARESFEADD
jgi:hypothetical protein